MGLDNMIRVKYERRANILILLALLIYIKMSPVCAAPPDLASELTVESITTTSATVRWGPNSVGTPPTFESYEVSITPPSVEITFTPGPHLTANSANPETTISGLTAGVEYTVSVRTVNGTETGTPKTITFNAKPNPFSGSSAISFTNVASTTATVRWSAPSGIFAEYVISVSPAGATLSPSSPVGAGTTFTTLTNLTPGTVYTTEVKTKSGESLSDPVTNTFTTKPVGVSDTSMIITALTADSAILTWDPVTTGTFDDYTISISGGATVNPTTVAKGAATTTLLTNMTPGTSYTVTLKTRTSGNVESDPATHTFTTKPEKVDAASLTVGNTATTTTATLTWGAVGTPFLIYEIAISPTSGGAKANPASVAKGTTTTALKSLTPGRLYTISIKTKSATLESDAVTMTFRTKPLPVTGVTLRQNVDKMTITWSAGAGSIQSSYKVRYRAIFQTPTSAWTEVTEIVLSKEISIRPGEKYEVEVIAISGDQSSDATRANIVTAPLPPATASVTNLAATSTSIEVTWTSPTPASYFIKYLIRYTKVGATATSQVEATSTELKKTILGLEAGVKYNVKIFTGTKESKMSETSTDTDGTAIITPSESRTSKPDQAVAIGVSVTAAVILAIVIVVHVIAIFTRRKRNEGAENKHRQQAEVTVENSAFADIYDELTEPPQAPEKETAVMSMVTRYLPSTDSETREKLQAIFTRLGVEWVSDLTYVKESDIVPPLTIIQARMFIEKVQEQEKKGSFDDVIYQEATVPPDQASAAVYVNVGAGLAVSGESAKSQTSEYASLQGFVKPDQNTYDQLGGVLRK